MALSQEIPVTRTSDHAGREQEQRRAGKAKSRSRPRSRLRQHPARRERSWPGACGSAASQARSSPPAGPKSRKGDDERRCRRSSCRRAAVAPHDRIDEQQDPPPCGHPEEVQEQIGEVGADRAARVWMRSTATLCDQPGCRVVRERISTRYAAITAIRSSGFAQEPRDLPGAAGRSCGGLQCSHGETASPAAPANWEGRSGRASGLARVHALRRGRCVPGALRARLRLSIASCGMTPIDRRLQVFITRLTISRERDHLRDVLLGQLFDTTR